jgi:carbamoyltransferase
MMQRFYELTGCPVIVNTSFNVRGEPICARAGRRCAVLHVHDIDALVLGNRLLLKELQPPYGWSRGTREETSNWIES